MVLALLCYDGFRNYVCSQTKLKNEVYAMGLGRDKQACARATSLAHM